MGRQKWTDNGVGARIRAERERSGWSQAQMARMLAHRGIEPMHATTLAKIETGDRSLRVTEAAGIADLLELSMDSLLGRRPMGQTDELIYRLRHLRDNAQKMAPQVLAEAESIREQIEDMPMKFDGDELLKRLGVTTCVQLLEVHDRITDLTNRSHDLLREQEEVVKQQRAAEVARR